tara:strand:+ start:724 stop:1674 length:951 start_codon:yes stop_codon:yes gene_type:complete
MAGVGSSSISFSGLKAAYVAGGGTGASGNSSLRDGKTTTAISLSDFRNASLTDGTSVPGSGEISINDDFKSKTFGSSNVTNHIQVKYHRYGSTFNDSWTPSGKSTLEDGTFTLYFWKTSDDSLTQLGRITNQQHSSTTATYTTVTYDVSQPEDTSGYLLFILYGWNFYRGDMAIGSVIHQYDDNSTKQTLYSPNSNATTAKNSQTWMNISRQLESVSSYSSTSVSDIEDEVATKSQSDSWSNLSTGTSNTGGWQQDKSGTPSGNTGPSRGSDASSSSYYIYCETSGQTSTNVIAYAALRVPITIESNSGSDDEGGL